MLPLLKKKTEAATSSLIPAWHPNFRNFAALPDIKPVRTAFFVNGFAALFAFALLVFLGQREYALHSINTQIATRQHEIDRDKPGSEQAVALYKKFQDEEKKLHDVETFVKSKPLISELLQRFGETRPKDIALEGLDIRAPDGVLPPSISVRGTVRGAPDLATGTASSYLDILKNDEVMGPKFDDVAFTANGVSRNSTTGRLRIDILIKFKAPPAPAVAKKP
jgi:hypothetical protein